MFPEEKVRLLKQYPAHIQKEVHHSIDVIKLSGVFTAFLLSSESWDSSASNFGTSLAVQNQSFFDPHSYVISIDSIFSPSNAHVLHFNRGSF